MKKLLTILSIIGVALLIALAFTSSQEKLGNKVSANQDGGRGQLRMAVATSTLLVTSSEYYQMIVSSTDSYNKNFSTNATGTITYSGTSGLYFLFNGATNFLTDKAALVTYGLYVNGALATGAESPIDIAASSKRASNAITRVIQLNNGDKINIWVKSDQANTTITVDALFLTITELP